MYLVCLVLLVDCHLSLLEYLFLLVLLLLS